MLFNKRFHGNLSLLKTSFFSFLIQTVRNLTRFVKYLQRLLSIVKGTPGSAVWVKLDLLLLKDCKCQFGACIEKLKITIFVSALINTNKNTNTKFSPFLFFKVQRSIWCSHDADFFTNNEPSYSVHSRYIVSRQSVRSRR